MANAINAETPYKYDDKAIEMYAHAHRILYLIKSDFVGKLAPNFDKTEMIHRAEYLSLSARLKSVKFILWSKVRNTAIFDRISKEQDNAGFIGNAKGFMDVCPTLLCHVIPLLRILFQLFEWQMGLFLFALRNNRLRQYKKPRDALKLPDLIISAPFTAQSLRDEMTAYQQRLREVFTATFVTRLLLNIDYCTVESFEDANQTTDSDSAYLDDLFDGNARHYEFLKKRYGDIMKGYTAELDEPLEIVD